MGLCFARKFHERTQDQLSKCFSRIPSRSPDFEGNERNELSLASVRFETIRQRLRSIKSSLNTSQGSAQKHAVPFPVRPIADTIAVGHACQLSV